MKFLTYVIQHFKVWHTFFESYGDYMKSELLGDQNFTKVMYIL